MKILAKISKLWRDISNWLRAVTNAIRNCFANKKKRSEPFPNEAPH